MNPPGRTGVSAFMRTARQPAILAACALLLASTVAAAQGAATVADEGILVISSGSSSVGREAFRVSRGGDGAAIYTLSATVSSGTQRLSPALSTDAAGTPLLYRADVRSGPGQGETIRATGRPGRLSAVVQRSGGESAREYVLGPRAIVLDEGVWHQHVLIPLVPQGAVTVVNPRKGTQLSARIVRQGEDQVVIDGKPVAAVRWALIAPDESREVWVDGSGRLLRVRAGGITATREELPR